MKKPVVMVGVGEMGGVFARGFLRHGHPVYPVTRIMDIQQTAAALPTPAVVPRPRMPSGAAGWQFCSVIACLPMP